MLKIELRPHIAQAVHPVTKAKLWDDAGKPIPLFPNQRSIWLDGHMIGYVCEPPKRGLSFIVPLERLPPEVVSACKLAVIKEFGDESKVVCAVPDAAEPIQEDYLDE